MAMVEACIDFGEGEDLEDGVYAQGKRPRSFQILAGLMIHQQSSLSGS